MTDVQNLLQALVITQYPFLHPQHWPHMLATALALVVLVNGRRYPWAFAGLGGFVLGQMIAALALPGWDVAAVFALSAALAVALGVLTRIAMRPLVALASFLGVGFLAYTLCGVLRVPIPWDLIAFAIAGSMAVAALFRWSFDRAMIVNSALAAAGLIIASTNDWIIYFSLWDGWTGVIVGGIALIVGIVHQNRALPAPQTTGPAISAAGRGNSAAGNVT